MRLRSSHVRQEITVETPMGPMVFEYAGTIKGAYTQDAIVGTYRSVPVFAPTIAGLHRRIAEVEAEHQSKRARDEKRRDLVKNPISAVLLHIGGWSFESRRTGQKRKVDSFSGTSVVYEKVLAFCPSVLEDVQVRGQDLRSYGQALIVRENGDKDQIAVEGASDRWDRTNIPQMSKPILLSALEDHQRADVVALCRAVERATANRPTRTSAEDAFFDAYGDEPIETFEIAYDPATEERVATFRGREIRKSNSKDVENHAIRLLLSDAGWAYDADDGLPILETSGHIGTVCRDADEYSTWLAHEDRIHAALVALGEGIADLRFDGTLLELPEDEPVREPDESPRATAPDPAGADW